MTQEEQRRITGVVRYIRRHIDVCNYRQIFNTRNRVGDVLRTVYADGSIILDVCDEWGYMEIFGVTDEEFRVIKQQLWNMVEEQECTAKLQRLMKVFTLETVKLICKNGNIDDVLNDEGFLKLEGEMNEKC